MPRRPRVQVEGYPLHIVQRGINREPCFFADEDFDLLSPVQKAWHEAGRER